jgi:hypothetical protein
MWMMVLADGCPVARFPVEPGCRFYPLILGMEADKSRLVTLIKETQCMPDAPEATVLLRSLRLDGELQPLHPRAYKIEFIGDSLTSGEGVLAPRDNEEWITPWFSARANYAWIACGLLDAEPRILSQSGYGVSWDWELKPEGNMSEGYRKIAGVMKGEAAEKRGCQKDYDFSAWQADVVCIRLLTNDVGAMMRAEKVEELGGKLTDNCAALIRTVRECNPKAKIVWILPDSKTHPSVAIQAVNRCMAEGIGDVSCFVVPDCTGADLGARQHPNAAYNQRIGLMLADYLRSLTGC